MTSKDNTPIPVATQKSILSDTLDATLLFTFLTGEQLVIICIYINTCISCRNIHSYSYLYYLLIWCVLVTFYTVLLVTANKARKKNSRSIFVTCSLFFFFATNIANLALNWKQMNICFIENGQSTLSAFIYNIRLDNSGYTLAIVILTCMQNVIADTLLVTSTLSNTIQ